MASGKKRKSLISRINIQVVEIDNEEMIKNAATNFFSRLYAKEEKQRLFIDNHFSSCVDVEGASHLECCFSEEKVKEAIFSIDKDKSLRPNDFSSLFYQEC